MKTRYLFLITLLLSLVMPTHAQINLNKLGKQIKKSAEQQVEQKIKEKSARETRNALDRGEKKLDHAVQDAVSGNASGKSSASKKSDRGVLAADKKTGSKEEIGRAHV